MSKLTMCIWPLITLIILGVTLFFNYTASTGLVSDLAVGEVADKYPLQLTPAGWTFTIWGFIYIWQGLWIIYVLYLTCKYEMNDIVFGKWFYIAYNFANICNGIWIIVWVNQYIIPAAILLVGIATGLIISGYIAHKYMFIAINKMATVNDTYGGVGNNDAQQQQQSPSQKNAKWLDNAKSIKPFIYAFALNGIPFYATWCVVASHLNVGIALKYEGGMTNTNASFLMLSILTCVILFYWYLDFYRFRNYLQYTYSPYIVLIVAFSGIISKGGLNTEERPSVVFTLILLIVAVIGTICKIIMGLSMRNKPVQSFQNV